jgi:hypothetical protein
MPNVATALKGWFRASQLFRPLAALAAKPSQSFRLWRAMDRSFGMLKHTV